MNLTGVREDMGLIPDLALCVKDLAFLWLRCRLAVAAPTQPLAWELPYAMGMALKRQKKKKEERSSHRGSAFNEPTSMTTRVWSLALLSGLRTWCLLWALAAVAKRGSDPTLLRLWHRPGSAALIWPLAWEPPYAMAAALKWQKKKKKKRKEKRIHSTTYAVFFPRKMNLKEFPGDLVVKDLAFPCCGLIPGPGTSSWHGCSHKRNEPESH